MTGGSRRPRLLGAAAAALLAAGGLAPTAHAGWATPQLFAPPSSLDVLGPQVAVSPSGAAAVSYAIVDADDSSNSAAFTAWRLPGARITHPRSVPSAQQVLAGAVAGGRLELLTGTAPAGMSCCSTVSVVSSGQGGSFGRSRTLVGGLAGTATATLLPLPGRLLAAVATERGVWVSQSDGSLAFHQVHRLTSRNAQPQAIATTALGNGGGAVAWIDAGRPTIFLASGTPVRAPGRAVVAWRVPGRDELDELALAEGRSTATLAWIESWYDDRGTLHSRVQVTDAAAHPRARSFEYAGAVASGLTLVADGRGDQVLAWRTCTLAATCVVRAAVRPSGLRFGSPQRVGTIDATENPALAIARRGPALLGWISSGHVFAAELRRGATRFDPAHRLSNTSYAANLTLAFGGSGGALAAWSQGTFAPIMMGAAFR